MMMKFVYGAAGTGKSAYLYQRISEDLQCGKKVMLIVPDQEAVCAEAELAALCEGISSFRLQILSFSRLCNDIFRTYGGLSYHYIDKKTGKLILFLALSSVKSLLTEFSDITSSDATLLSSLYDTVCEMKKYSVTPAMLEQACEKVPQECTLGGKLHDMMLIYAAYNAFMQGCYDDPLDDMEKADQILAEHNYFSGACVYIDSFDGFLPAQYRLIRHMAKGADRLTVSVCCELHAQKEALSFDIIHDMEEKLLKIQTETHCDFKVMELQKPRRFQNSELRHLEEKLRRGDTKHPYPGHCTHVDAKVLPDIFAEAEYVAKDILRRVRGGVRYRNIAVILRSKDTYRGVLDAVFEKYGLPYFFSVRTDLNEKSIVKFALSAFSVLIYHYRRTDIISYMKTGLLTVGNEESDLFEEYIERWNISGKRFYDFIPYHMNPRGYVASMTEQDEKALESVNAAREKIIHPLFHFTEALRGGKKSAAQISAALYKLFEEAEVKAALEEKYRRAVSYGDMAEAEELLQLYNVFWECVDTLCEICKELPLSAAEYRELLEMVISETDVGKIPTAVDEILIADASLIRAADISCTYLLGLNEGEFPKASENASVFSSAEKRALAEAGIEFSYDEQTRLSRERFLFYRCVSLASNDVVLTAYGKSLSGESRYPSVFLRDVLRIFPALTERLYAEAPLSEKIEGESASFEYLAFAPDTPEGRALYRLYAEKPEYRRLLGYLKEPLSKTEERLTREGAEKVFGDTVYLSQSKLERFAGCKFDYYCHYVLKLEEHRKNTFERSNIGSFVHYIMQRLMEDYAKNPLIASKSRKELSVLVDAYIFEYLSSVLKISVVGGELLLSKRLSGLVRRMKRNVLCTVCEVLKETKNSRFIPRDFELPIGLSEGAVAPYRLTLPDGSAVLISGIADRVDVYPGADGTSYIKIVDYKSGSKTFKLSDIEEGNNLQLFMYVISLCENARGKYENPKPAALIYMTTTAKEISLNEIRDEAEIQSLAVKGIERKGIVLDNDDVRSAFGEDIRTLKAEFKNEEEMNALFESVKEVIRKETAEMKSGVVKANPKNTGGAVRCRYCPYKPVCRIENTTEKPY